MQAAHDVVALAGFHIKRQEFEPEYDNEAEMIVADMEFKEDDTEVSNLPSPPWRKHDFCQITPDHVLLSFLLDMVTFPTPCNCFAVNGSSSEQDVMLWPLFSI